MRPLPPIQVESAVVRLVTAACRRGPVLAALGLVAVGGWVGPAAAQAPRLAPAPTLVIGELDGGAPYLFHDVVDAAFASGGRIVVADGGAQAVRVFGPDGRFLVEMGGPGEGPGEFQWLRGIWMASPDTVGVWDGRSRRFSFFTVDGDLVATHPVVPEAGERSNLDVLVGGLDDGSVVLGAITLGPPRADGARADRVALLRFAPDGRFLDRVGVMSGLVRRRSGRGSGPVAFSPFAYATVHGNAVVTTDGAAPVVEVLTPGGATRRVRVPAAPVDADAAWAALDERAHDLPAMFAPLLDDAPRDGPIPVLAGLLVDDEGRAWTKAFDPATDALWLRGGGAVAGGAWWVVGLDGGDPVRVGLPPGFRPLAVEGGRMLGVLTDEFGVERVAVYRLR